MVLALFLLWKCGDKQKKHKKKIGKNNRGWGKFRHFVCVKKIEKRESI